MSQGFKVMKRKSKKKPAIQMVIGTEHITNSPKGGFHKHTNDRREKDKLRRELQDRIDESM